MENKNWKSLEYKTVNEKGEEVFKRDYAFEIYIDGKKQLEENKQ